MPKRIVLSLFLISAAMGPAASQDRRGGIRTETMDRMADQQSGMDLVWNLIGAVGLLGLLGLRKEHPDDSYHPASIE
jgi:hypothetical protein